MSPGLGDEPQNTTQCVLVKDPPVGVYNINRLLSCCSYDKNVQCVVCVSFVCKGKKKKGKQKLAGLVPPRENSWACQRPNITEAETLHLPDEEHRGLLKTWLLLNIKTIRETKGSMEIRRAQRACVRAHQQRGLFGEKGQRMLDPST